MRILIVGAGAVGGYFGARLAQAGRDVTFLVRARRAEALHKDGLHVVSPHGDCVIDHPQVVEASGITAPFDLILLSVKGYTLDSAIADIRPAVGPDTMILPTLNGMRHIDRLVAAFGEKNVLGGACRVVAELDDRGRIVQMAPVQSLVFGELSGLPTARVKALEATLTGAGFDAALSGAIVRDMWSKWVNLAALGGITCMLGGSIGSVSSVRDGKRVAESVVREALVVADAHGYPVAEAEATRMIATLTDRGSKLTSSMFRDMKAGKDVEAEEIIGDMVDKADAKGLDVPLLRAAAVALRVYASAT